MQSPSHLWCYKCDKGIVYFPDDAHESDTNSASSSAGSSPPHSHNRSNGHRPRASPRRVQSAVPPSQWKSSQSILKSTPIWHESMNGGMCGMQNLGNTCFMNASLQALLHCPAVVYLFTLPEVGFVKRHSRVRLVEEFVRLTRQIWEGKHRNVIPKDILRCIMVKFPQFRGYGQQDAHEFLTCLLQFLHDQYKYLIPVTAPKQHDHADDADEQDECKEPKQDSDQEVEEEEQGGSKRRKLRDHSETSLIYDLFSGEMISSVECCRCNTKSTKIENITNIQVEIPKPEQVCLCLSVHRPHPCTACVS